MQREILIPTSSKDMATRSHVAGFPGWTDGCTKKWGGGFGVRKGVCFIGKYSI